MTQKRKRDFSEGLKKKKQIKVTEKIIIELSGTKIAKYLISIGTYKDHNDEEKR